MTTIKGTASPLYLSPSGRGRFRRSRNRVRASHTHDGCRVRSIASNTPSEFSYTSVFVTRKIRNPFSSRIRVRSASRARSVSVECVAPSTSMMSLPSRVTKSTMYPSIGCWRRNFHRANLRFRSANHSFASALVCDARKRLALCLNRSIPLTRRLRRRPLPAGERYSTRCTAI
jgi:hypothetical protein